MSRWVTASVFTTVLVILVIAVVFRNLTMSRLDYSDAGTLGVETEATGSGYSKLTDTVNDILEKSKKPLDVEQQVATERLQDALSRVKVLEIAIQDLRGQIKYLQQFNPANGSTSTQPSISASNPVFIPLGVGGTTNSGDWQTLPTPEIEINPADYPGYKSVFLIVDLKSTGGTAEVRLTNHSDNSPLTTSLIATSLTDFSSLSSNSFSLPSATKKYRLQIRNNGGSETTVLFAKLKLTF